MLSKMMKMKMPHEPLEVSHLWSVFCRPIIQLLREGSEKGTHKERTWALSAAAGRTSEERPFKVRVFPVVVSSVTLAEALKSQRAREGNTLCRSFHV